eukprot:CAMPEP_0113944356 /NCGR_PEP_ID=MMETSP1339-20121228/33729_1 /TAXON_ID=94617 /ORGANISM="Fibrocapsa japonica" /LENGTH=133 /DNA_ID=CAMNT_0000949533 /DNA_START=225 /DNA_END=626 /DNA_ORIENTATION=+ /assembly_acc=CAM_ASM_000762
MCQGQQPVEVYSKKDATEGMPNDSEDLMMPDIGRAFPFGRGEMFGFGGSEMEDLEKGMMNPFALLDGMLGGMLGHGPPGPTPWRGQPGHSSPAPPGPGPGPGEFRPPPPAPHRLPRGKWPGASPQVEGKVDEV